MSRQLLPARRARGLRSGRVGGTVAEQDFIVVAKL